MALEVVTAAAVPVPVAPPKLALIPAPMSRAVVLALPILVVVFLPNRAVAIEFSMLAVVSGSSVLPTLLVILIPICSSVSAMLLSVLFPKLADFFPMIVSLSVPELPTLSSVLLPNSFFLRLRLPMIVCRSAMSAPFVILVLPVQTVLLLVLDVVLSLLDSTLLWFW